MAALENTFMPVYSRTFGSELSTFTQRIVAAVISWNDNRASRKALSQLTDRQLEDIGLSRFDI
ncbi:MAG TPA: primosomal protein DnaI [Maritimibacter sp.]|nr:primosomal protein DnaI [Maritimibacter sp.]